MGVVEVLPHLRRILARIRETADDIVRKNPDVVVTIVHRHSRSSGHTIGRALQRRKST